MQDLEATASFRPIPNQNVIVQDVFEEVLVYDLEREIVRRLNRTAAAIWKQCDGSKNVGEITRAVARQFEGRVDEQVVLLTLRRFSKAHLLTGPAPEIPAAKRVSRRELIKRIGIAAVPLGSSIGVPTVMPAVASCFPLGHTCSANSQCCSGNCVFVVGMGVICT